MIRMLCIIIQKFCCAAVIALLNVMRSSANWQRTALNTLDRTLNSACTTLPLNEKDHHLIQTLPRCIDFQNINITRIVFCSIDYMSGQMNSYFWKCLQIWISILYYIRQSNEKSWEMSLLSWDIRAYMHERKLTEIIDLETTFKYLLLYLENVLLKSQNL